MGAALLIAKSRLRRNLTATFLLIVLAGIGGGVVMASVAATRRADAGWRAFQATNPDGDAVAAVMTEDFEFPTLAETDFAAEAKVIKTFPGVAGVARGSALVATNREVGSDQRASAVVAMLWLDDPIPAVSGKPILLSGRFADPDAPDETVIDEEEARLQGVGLGDELEVTPYAADQFDDLDQGVDFPAEGEPSRVRVVGIVRLPSDVLGPRTGAYSVYTSDPYLELTPAWWTTNSHDVAAYGVGIGVDLEDGPAGFERFNEQMVDAFGETALVAPGLEFDIGIQPETRTAISGRISAEGRALLAFAVVSAIVAAAIVGQALLRQLRSEQADQDALVALGIGRREMVVAGLARSASLALGAGAVAAAVAVALSSHLPIGVGARVLHERGLDMDGPVVLGGVLVVTAAVVALAAIGSVRPRSELARSRRRRTVADRSAALGMPTSVTVGLRMAFDRSLAGRAGQAAVGATALALATAVAAGGLVTSYHHLVAESDRVGQPWDASAGNFANPEGLARGVETLRAIDGVEALAGEVSSTVEIEGRTVTAMGYTEEVGHIEPLVYEGRAPAAVDEAMLGEGLARSIGVEIGDEIDLQVPFSDARLPPFRVVGIGVAGGALIDTPPATSVLLHADVLQADPDSEVAQELLVRYADDADPDAVFAEIQEVFKDSALPAPILPRTVQTIGSLTSLPVVLAAIVALLAGGVVVNALVGSVRRRRGELAVLKALGCDRRQVASIVAWQATGWGAVGVVVGVPLGLLVGSVAWKAVLRSLGLHSATSVPWLVVVGLPLAALLVVNLVALLPGRTAAAIPAAEALRTE